MRSTQWLRPHQPPWDSEAPQTRYFDRGLLDWVEVHPEFRWFERSAKHWSRVAILFGCLHMETGEMRDAQMRWYSKDRLQETPPDGITGGNEGMELCPLVERDSSPLSPWVDVLGNVCALSMCRHATVCVSLCVCVSLSLSLSLGVLFLSLSLYIYVYTYT